MCKLLWILYLFQLCYRRCFGVKNILFWRILLSVRFLIYINIEYSNNIYIYIRTVHLHIIIVQCARTLSSGLTLTRVLANVRNPIYVIFAVSSGYCHIHRWHIIVTAYNLLPWPLCETDLSNKSTYPHTAPKKSLDLMDFSGLKVLFREIIAVYNIQSIVQERYSIFYFNED